MLKRAFKGVLYLVYVGIVVAILLEVGVRFFAPQPLPQDRMGIHAPDAELAWIRLPNLRLVTNTGERDVPICTDGDGFRVACEQGVPRACDKRILVIGDSFVEALAIPYEETVWSLLEEELGACVLVAGVGGYNPVQYIAVAKRLLIDRQTSVDLVILNLYAGNDFTTEIDYMPPSENVAAPPLRLLPSEWSRSGLFAWLYPVNKRFEAHSHAYVALRASALRILDPEGVVRSGLPDVVLRSRLTDAHVRQTVEAVRRVSQSTAAAETPLLVTILPFRNQVLDADGARLRREYPTLAADIDMDQVESRFVPIARQLEGDIEILDLLPSFRLRATSESWGTRDPHLSPHGHRVWFESLKDTVAGLLNRSNSVAHSRSAAAE